MSLRIRLLIDGVDRTANLLERQWSIEANAFGVMDIADFTLRDPTLVLDAVEGKTVLIEKWSDATVRYFGGVLTEVLRQSDGGIGRTLGCKALDWTFVLERALTTQKYVGKSDLYIISEAVASPKGIFASSDTTLTDFDAATYVQQGIANTQFAQYRRDSIREILDALAAQAGYVWWVDAFKKIHYQPYTTSHLGFGLSDSPDESTTFRMFGARRRTDVSQVVNAVTVEGGTKRKTAQSQVYPSDGSIKILHGLAWWVEEDGQTRIRVDRNTGSDGAPAWTAQAVGLRGNPNDEAALGVTIDVLWDPGARTLTWNTAPPNFATNSYRVRGDQLIPLIHKEPDESSIAAFGREYGLSIKDETLVDEEQVVFRALAELRKYKAKGEAITCRTLKDGITVGSLISFRNAALGLSTATDYFVQKVVTKLLGGQVAGYDLTLTAAPS